MYVYPKKYRHYSPRREHLSAPSISKVSLPDADDNTIYFLDTNSKGQEVGIRRYIRRRARVLDCRIVPTSPCSCWPGQAGPESRASPPGVSSSGGGLSPRSPGGRPRAASSTWTARCHASCSSRAATRQPTSDSASKTFQMCPMN